MDFAGLTNDALLDKLDAERLPKVTYEITRALVGLPFRQPDKALIHTMIDELIRRGVYPKKTVESNPNDVRTMVDGWGARWFEWKGHLSCLHCKTDLRDYRLGPPFKLEIGVSANDRVQHYECSKCLGILPRYPTK